MEYLNLMLLISLLTSFLSFIFSLIKQHPKSSKLPPGPKPFPIVGNILNIGTKPHISLTNLSKTYGPLMSLKLGTITTIVISSPELAKEVLHKNDQIFSGRTVSHAFQTHDHHKVSMAFMDSSSKWRTLRKFSATNIFSRQRLDSTQILHRRKVQDLLDHVEECCSKGESLDVGQAAFTTVLNIFSNIFFSRDLAGFASHSPGEFKDLIWAVMEEGGRPNVADFFPFLRFLDPQGVRARMDYCAGKVFAFIDGIIEERMKDRDDFKTASNASGDVLDSFILLMEDSQLSRKDVIHLIADLFVAGVDTTSSTIEWAMAELLRNPEKLDKARKELQQALSKGTCRNREQSDISSLPFLRAVLKETLRLHPAAPLLVPHKSQEDAQLCGFTVPKNAQILVNLWAMGRGPNIWSDSDLFLPERFLNKEIDFVGTNFEFIPFGSGRRMCPGLPLANRVMPLVLASLLRNYDWKLAAGMEPHELDMDEKFGITLGRVQALRVVPNKV